MRGIHAHLAGLLAIGLLMVGAQSASAATLVVDNTGDMSGQDCEPATTDCSLRSAVGIAAALPGHDDITFDPAVFTGGATTPSVIDVGSDIIVQSDVAINGGDCDPGAGSKPCVGINATGNSVFVVFTADPVSISGLAIWGAEGSAIHSASTSAPDVKGSWFGVKLDGTTLEGNESGVTFLNGGDGVIGGSTLADRNVFAANNTGAITLANGSSGNTISGNRIGVLPGGASVEPGVALQTGIRIQNATNNNVIGGAVNTVGQCDGACNLIVNQGGTGILFMGIPTYGSNNVIQGNFVGLGANGTADQGNGGRGIDIGDAANTSIGDTATDRNYIAGNGGEGIWAIGDVGAPNLLVDDNFIGLSADGETAIPNGGSGLYMAGPDNEAVDNRFGGNGARIGTGTTFQDNVIGLGPGGEDVGVSVAEPGLEIAGNSTIVSGNTIGNVKSAADAAVFFTGGASNNLFEGNYVGTAPGGLAAPNAAEGIKLGGSNALSNNSIGGLDPGEANVISNSATDAIAQVQCCNGNRYEGNLGKDNGSGPNDLFIDIGTNGPGNPSSFYNDGIVPPSSPTIESSFATGPAGSARNGATVAVYATYTGRGDVRALLGTTTAQADGSWAAGYPVQTSGQCIALAQTDVNGNSSELSPPTAVGGGTCIEPPITTVTSGPAEGSTIADDTPTFTFTSEPGTTFECRIDGESFDDCTSPFTTEALADGPHGVHIRATQTTGNPALSPEVGAEMSRSFVVDTTGPTTSFTSGPAQGSTIGASAATISFNADEPGSTFECSVDGGAFTGCTSPLTLTGLASGSHSVAVRATDSLDNTGPVATRSFSVDTTVPDTAIGRVAVAKKLKKGKGKATVTFSGTARGVLTFTCKLDGGGFAPCASPKTYKGLRPGRHTVTVQATDAFGRTDPTPASATFRVKKKKKK